MCVTWSEGKLKAGRAVGRISGYPKPRLSAGHGSEDERAGTIKVGSQDLGLKRRGSCRNLGD